MPERTCLGCRRVLPKQSLVRLTVRGGVLTVDGARVMGGRGAYVCADRKCIEAARNKNAFSRSFKMIVDLPGLEELIEAIEETVKPVSGKTED